MVLILGNGFVGEALSISLLKQGYQVKVFSFSKGNVKGVEYREGNWLYLDQHKDFFNNVSTVIHTIHTSVPYSSMQDVYADAKTNILPSIKFFDILKEKGIKNSIYLSSGGAVYGEPLQPNVDESHTLHPVSAYGISKQCIESYIGLYNFQHNLNITIVRPSNLYGIGQDIKKKQGLIAHLIASFTNSQTFNIWGDGMGYKDYLNITDFINALTLLINNLPKTPRVYNIAYGQTYSILELIEKVETTLKSKLKTKHLAKQNFDVSSITLDPTQFKKDYNWKPKISIDEGILNFIENIQ